MTAQTLTVAQSKPDLQAQLRATWRKSREHYWEQAKRFVRIYLGVLMPQLLALGFGHLTRSALIALAAPAIEVAFRQWYPALGAKAADQADGVTIVPEQVGAVSDVPAVDPAVPDVPEDDSGLAGLDTGPTESPVLSLPAKTAAAKAAAKKAPAKKTTARKSTPKR